VAGPLLDLSSSFGARVAGHLRDDVVAWFTTVSPSGTPLPSVVWIVWDGDREVVMFSRETTRLTNLARNPRVSLNFPGDGNGGDVVVLTGEAHVDRDGPAVHETPGYVEKYGERIAGMGLSPETFGRRYHVRVRIGLTRVRGH
jgi:PPOX class probable F420-dependent enzyme